MATQPNYSLQDFNDRLHHTLLCSSDLTSGTFLRKKKFALKHDYIQFNDLFIKFLVLDIDRPSSALDWEELHLPAPHFVVVNPENLHCHYIYALEIPICRTDNARLKPLEYFAKIQQAYTDKLNADRAFAGLLTKNPNSNAWNVTQWARYPYSLDYLAEFVELPKRLTKRTVIGEGRNVYLFDTIRRFAYKEVLFYKLHKAKQPDFYAVLLAKLERMNVFPNSEGLGFNELKSIAKSVSKWVWRNFSIEDFVNIQSNRGKSSSNKRWGLNSKEDRRTALRGELL